MTTSQALVVDEFILEAGPSETIMKATMNRYRSSDASRGSTDAGYIILFAHGTGFHKESWEPTIEHLFDFDEINRSKNKNSKILECWAIDCQNHGAAAPLNDEILLRQPGVLDITYYSDAFAKLYNSGLLGVTNIAIQKVIIIGHSAGAIGTVLATALFEPPSSIPFDMLILVDPPLFSAEMKDDMTPMYRTVEQTTPRRRAIWNSKEEALAFFQKRIPWKAWDTRVLKLYAQHSLRPLPSPFYPDEKGVGLICSPRDEAAAFSGTAHTLKAIEQLNKICNILPVHLILGARNDMFSRELQDSIHDPTIGRFIASVSRVKGAGHLIVQEKPEALADAIHIILNKNVAKL